MFVLFTYRAYLFNVPGLHHVKICLSRENGQSWKDAALDLLERSGGGGSGTATGGGGGTAIGGDGDHDWGSEDWGNDWWDDDWQEQQ